MYAVTFGERTVYTDELTFGRNVDGKWIRADKEKGQALFIGGQLCNVKGKEPVEGLPFATIGKVDAGDVLAGLLTRLQNIVEKLEESQDAMCDLSVDIEDVKDALCDLSLEVSKP